MRIATRFAAAIARQILRLVAIIPITAVLLFPVASAAFADSDVLISELCDPHLNYLTDRFIEIYNAGSSAVDLDGWSLVAVGNGGDIFTWNLSGQIDPGDALVAGDATTTIEFTVDFPDEAWSQNNGLWNGKVGDGAKLLAPGDVVVDYVVVPGTTFENEDLVRRYEITSPNTVYTPSQWSATPVELPTDASPGAHSAAPPPQGPVITNVVTAPALPISGDTVDVVADVVDTNATIASVILRWGTDSDSLLNAIGMSVLTGDTYMTDAPIPSHSEGQVVYFSIRATNQNADSSTTEIQSYALPYHVTVQEIQGDTTSSPYDGDVVITSGVVTGRYSSHFVIQDGSGAWDGVWVRSSTSLSRGDSVSVRALVTESADQGETGNTLLVDAVIIDSSAAAVVPEAVVVSTSEISLEGYEGVLVEVTDAVCTDPSLGLGQWEIDDGTGAGRVDDLGYHFTPTLGSSYNVVGPVVYTYGHFAVEPRDAGDISWTGDDFAPIILTVITRSDTTVLVTFSEELDEATAETAANYNIDSLAVVSGVLDDTEADQVLLTVSAMAEREYTLIVNGVEDLFGNPTIDASYAFEFVDNGVPEGYYDTAEGLEGEALKAALHEIIDDHTVYGYDFAWTAFYTTDDKPNGKVWDIYSDIPGGVPPYEYTFGVDQGGPGGAEGNGYSREHSWPKSWFGGDVSPMESDLFALYPCDTHVNGNRGAYPYGEVAAPEWTSLNGSMRGNCSYPGYSGVVFEPIDEYKGDLARTYFYMSTRYYSEDASWPGSDMTDGAELLPWAKDILLEWHWEDPVSQKEIDRNNTVFGFQSNRNPFVDRPEFALLFAGNTSVVAAPTASPVFLEHTTPNPFAGSTEISYSLTVSSEVDLRIYDVAGRLVRELLDDEYDEPGDHTVLWNGRDGSGREVASGVYFYRIQVGQSIETRRMILLK